MTPLYVSGYWPLKENRKNSPKHYQESLIKTLQMLQGEQIVFHSNSDTVLEEVLALGKAYSVVVFPIQSALHALPNWDRSASFVQCCERMRLDRWPHPQRVYAEKGVRHYWRDWKGSGAETYRSLLSIWLSKPELTYRAGISHQAETVAWIDASVSRFNGQRTHWEFPRIRSQPGSIVHYASPMRYFGAPLPLNASYLAGSIEVWSVLVRVFNQVSEEALAMAYAHDEETLLAECVRRQPELFHCIGLPFQCLSGFAILRFQLRRRLRLRP